MGLVANILGIVSGVLMVVKDSTRVMTGVDLIVVNGIVVVVGLMLFRKTKATGWIQDDYVQQPGY